MNIHLVLKDIDYKSFISFVNENAGHIFGLLGLGNLNNIAVKAINGGETLLIHKLQKLCEERGVNIRLNSIHAEQLDPDTIELVGDIEEIDLAAVAGLFIPILQKRLSADGQLAFLSETMQTNPEAFTSCLSAFAERLSVDEKEKLMVSAINTFNQKIIDAIKVVAKDKNLAFTVVALLAE